jgi:cytochrome d ubiquinol oxidase subunit II
LDFWVPIRAVSLWTPFINAMYFQRWFGWPTAFFSAFGPLLLALWAFLPWHGLKHDRHL